MLGDNCLNKESNIPDERVIGVLTGFYRGNKQVNMNGLPYRAYVRTWYALYPLRRCAMRVRALAGRVKRRVLGGAPATPGAGAPTSKASVDTALNRENANKHGDLR